MFGYVRCDKGEMKVKEYEVYRGLYCSLCKAMRKHFGVFSTLTLSYDITFFLLMRLSFKKVIPHFKGGRCIFNPSKKCNYCQNGEAELKYAAAVSMMMFYHKVKDDIADGKGLRRLFMYLILPYAFFKNKKASSLYPEMSLIIAESMKRQAETERENTACSDKAAHESADALGKLLSYGFNENETDIYRFGYGVGKWVYLCDAVDDMEKDIKSGGYNVFVNMLSLKKGKEITKEELSQIEGILNLSLYTVSESFKKIENKTLIPIIENIIYDGTENVMNKILKGKEKYERPL